MFNLNYETTKFILSTPNLYLMPSYYTGNEVAFLGYSNAGKSSALNTLANQKKLARTSKVPGCTKFINLFKVGKDKILVDFPGYGYAKVSHHLTYKWHNILPVYLQKRQSLKGLVILMDIRHPFKSIDQQIINLGLSNNLPILVLLTKADKLLPSIQKKQLNMVNKTLLSYIGDIQVEIFSSIKKIGVDKLRQKLDFWLLTN